MKPPFLRRLGVLDLTLITIGTIIGSGIFRAPAVVAQRAHLPSLILGCWIAGGIIALIGALVFAELASRRPLSGGLYAYLRDAYHPSVAFLFGWTELLIADTGASAASAVLFAGYFEPLTGLSWDPRVVAVLALGAVASINCLGVRQGASWQNFLVALKFVALSGLIAAGLFAHPHAALSTATAPFIYKGTFFGAIGVAMLPVLMAYFGFQRPSYVTAETTTPERTIPRGLLFGVLVVVIIYVLVNVGCLRVLGVQWLATTRVPASDVMQAALGALGSRAIEIAIVLSTLGFISTTMLLTPRLYFQMAADGLFFKQVAWIHPTTHVPVVAIALQCTVAAMIAFSGTWEQIVNWIVAPRALFMMLAAAALFILRYRDGGRTIPKTRVPGHPFTTCVFIVALLYIVTAEFFIYPRDTLYGAVVILVGIAFYVIWQREASGAAAPPQPTL